MHVGDWLQVDHGQTDRQKDTLEWPQYPCGLKDQGIHPDKTEQHLLLAFGTHHSTCSRPSLIAYSWGIPQHSWLVMVNCLFMLAAGPHASHTRSATGTVCITAKFITSIFPKMYNRLVKANHNIQLLPEMHMSTSFHSERSLGEIPHWPNSESLQWFSLYIQIPRFISTSHSTSLITNGCSSEKYYWDLTWRKNDSFIWGINQQIAICCCVSQPVCQCDSPLVFINSPWQSRDVVATNT